MKALEVVELKKEYPSFTLKGVSFSIEEGRILGLIGRNGAGKTTTLKGILRLIEAEGSVKVFDRDTLTDELAVKEQIGYVGGGFRYYPFKTLATIKKNVARFYKSWDEARYRRYLELFELDESKTVRDLSEGMKVKFFITLALSHGARLLIMDEPTSGLDPLSREEFCDVILSLVRKEGVTVLFSTHITSDLEKIADDVVYISNGEVLLSSTTESLLARYKLLKFTKLEDIRGVETIGVKEVKNGYEALVEGVGALPEGCTLTGASIEQIMVHFEKERG